MLSFDDVTMALTYAEPELEDVVRYFIYLFAQGMLSFSLQPQVNFKAVVSRQWRARIKYATSLLWGSEVHRNQIVLRYHVGQFHGLYLYYNGKIWNHQTRYDTRLV